MAEDCGADSGRSRYGTLARAKVNLTLRVLGRRADGYHELQSLVAFADVGDEVELDLTAPPSVSMKGPYAIAISGPNLVETTLQRLAQTEPRFRLGAVTIEKNLPVAAGLGGGSADAAATLRVIRAANPAFAHSIDWLGIAASLGADVPVCFLDRTALMWGIGEKLRAVDALPRLPAVLVTPDADVPADKTRQVFRELAAGPVPESNDSEPDLPPSLECVDELVNFLRQYDNDLAAPARKVVPAIADAEGLLAACAACLLVRVSGAGPTCYGIFPNPEIAQAAAQRISAARPNWWVRAVTLGD
ncbi:MAG: 4-(cytidine 5'-diphospho)-2-C-methyl-D-erythritol kinase [Proteobacteria bacterium]|jgi:4-diphosphocytidyl-2C-methyl-D-erythritol 2-phosphate synthase|nr:MAG: 4-(cytidine 5'-diphospho)-2-C-methyl-D-erythritol kinase [Pseudomonadota bacterium]